MNQSKRLDLIENIIYSIIGISYVALIVLIVWLHVRTNRPATSSAAPSSTHQTCERAPASSS